MKYIVNFNKELMVIQHFDVIFRPILVSYMIIRKNLMIQFNMKKVNENNKFEHSKTK